MDYVKTHDLYCSPQSRANWTNITDAKQKCSENPDCGMILEQYGRNNFYYCPKNAGTYADEFGSTLYTRGIWILFYSFTKQFYLHVCKYYWSMY